LPAVQVAIPIFDRVTALDAVGPYEVLSRIPGTEVLFVAAEPGLKRTENEMLALAADRGLSEVPSPEIVVVPGGYGTRALLDDRTILDWIEAAHETARWTTSVCTGALLLGAAGVLRGLRATTHWLSLERLREFGAEPTSERVVEQGKVITAAGVSSGIDMALRLCQKIGGDDLAQMIQLSIEYDPQPPFDAGSPQRAPAHVVEAVTNASRRNDVEAATGPS
jgi:transcriptional regulator GlxA family with amidase domain